MDLRIRPYDLPDVVLLQPSAEVLHCMVWRPERTMIVIGKGSEAAREIKAENAAEDEVPVLRRSTGGAAVVLSPAMLAVSLSVQQAEQLPSREYFHIFNSLIIEALSRQGIERAEQQGTSDLAIDGRKIAGSAIYRNRQLVFFHAILNVGGDARDLERYLKIPPRMPEYRDGRSHTEFVTSLAELGQSLDAERFAHDLAALMALESFRSLTPAVQAVPG